MVDYGRIKSTVKPKAKVIDDKSVWINTDITKVIKTVRDKDYVEYEFNQVRYDKDEYISMIDDKNEMLEAQVTDTQLALCEVYELML